MNLLLSSLLISAGALTEAEQKCADTDIKPYDGAQNTSQFVKYWSAFTPAYLGKGEENCNLMTQNKYAVLIYKFLHVGHGLFDQWSALGWASSTVAIKYDGYGSYIKDALNTKTFTDAQKKEMAKSPMTTNLLRLQVFGKAGGFVDTLAKLHKVVDHLDSVFQTDWKSLWFFQAIDKKRLLRAWAGFVDKVVAVGFGVWPRATKEFPDRTVKQLSELIGHNEVLTYLAKAIKETVATTVATIFIYLANIRGKTKPPSLTEYVKSIQSWYLYGNYFQLMESMAKMGDYALKLKFDERAEKSVLRQLLFDTEQKLLEEVGNFFAFVLAELPYLVNMSDLYNYTTTDAHGNNVDTDIRPYVLYGARAIKAAGYGIRLLASAAFGEDEVDTSPFTFRKKNC